MYPRNTKFTTAELPAGAQIVMYGVVVARAARPIRRGEVLTTNNVSNDSAQFHSQSHQYHWTPPDISRWEGRTFRGYHRADGQVGTRNYWLVVPLVFCENRNIIN